MKLAKTKHRVAAYLVDFVITGLITAIICLLFSIDIYGIVIDIIAGFELHLDLKDVIAFYRSIFISTLLICAYYTLVPFLFDGQTLGKKFFRIKVVNEKGEKASLKRLFIREVFGKYLLNFVSFFFGHIISFVLMQSRKDKKSIADILAATVVIDVAPKQRKIK